MTVSKEQAREALGQMTDGAMYPARDIVRQFIEQSQDSGHAGVSELPSLPEPAIEAYSQTGCCGGYDDEQMREYARAARALAAPAPTQQPTDEQVERALKAFSTWSDTATSRDRIRWALTAALSGAAPTPQPELTDEQVDRMLSAAIPGGSQARDWFLPHEHPKGLANVRNVVRSLLGAAPTPQAGWKLVPVEPTALMVGEGSCAQSLPGPHYISTEAARQCWKFMLEAAPTQPEPIANALHGAILDALMHHSMCHTVEDEETALPLVDMVTPRGDRDIGRGKEELERLADAIFDAVEPFAFRAPTVAAQAPQQPVAAGVKGLDQ